MVTVRAAGPQDAAELVRLRRLMFAAMKGVDEPGSWEETARSLVVAGLDGAPDGPRLGAFVVDAWQATDSGAAGPGADGPGVSGVSGGSDGRVAGGRLAACAVGTIEQRLPAPGHPSGRFGFVFNVCTDPAYRGRGCARAATEALLAWFTAHGVTRVDLHATAEAEAMYRSMGFAEHSTALSLTFGRPGRPPEGPQGPQ